MISYTVYVEASVAEFLPRLKYAERERLLRFLQKLRADPFLAGDYIEHDDIGRPLQVFVIGRHAVVFWADHAVKEVKILDLKPAGN
jgi:mRNA-degrading endonuclease RelE of RelBE toxin-antitoxin system